MLPTDFTTGILRTLLYYEIFQHPLTLRELYALSPGNPIPYQEFRRLLTNLVDQGVIKNDDDFYRREGGPETLSGIRRDRERLARRRLKISRAVGGLVRRFPFVRGVFISGDLSKGVATPPSDIDYVILTEPGRLWICRTILILFKKIFLLNRKKYFCMNYFVAADHLRIEDRNYYIATEIAHLKPLSNTPLFLRFMNANSWIKNEFPNFTVYDLAVLPDRTERTFLRTVLEIPFRGTWADWLDRRLMHHMEQVWKRRYREFDDVTRNRIFKCAPHESRAFAGNFAERIDELYRRKLSELSGIQPEHTSA